MPVDSEWIIKHLVEYTSNLSSGNPLDSVDNRGYGILVMINSVNVIHKFSA